MTTLAGGVEEGGGEFTLRSGIRCVTDAGVSMEDVLLAARIWVMLHG